MEGFPIRGWYLIFPGWRWLYDPKLGIPHRAGRIDRGATVFVPGLKSWTRGKIYDYQPLISGVGASTPFGAVSTGETIVFIPSLLKL